MKCPKCTQEKKRCGVLETRTMKGTKHDIVFRRRECPVCGHEWWTQEIYLGVKPPKFLKAVRG